MALNYQRVYVVTNGDRVLGVYIAESEEELNEFLLNEEGYTEPPDWWESDRVISDSQQLIAVSRKQKEAVEDYNTQLENPSFDELCDMADDADSETFGLFWETHDSTRVEDNRQVLQDIIDGNARHCEDCGDLFHVEGSEFCKVSYPEGII